MLAGEKTGKTESEIERLADGIGEFAEFSHKELFRFF